MIRPDAGRALGDPTSGSLRGRLVGLARPRREPVVSVCRVGQKDPTCFVTARALDPNLQDRSVTHAEVFRDIEGLYGAVPYAYAARAAPNTRIVFLAGSCPLDHDGNTVAPGNVAEQAAACLANMQLALAATGAGLGDIVFIRALVASSDRADLALVWDLVSRTFRGQAPPGTLLGTTVLGWPDQLVEIEAVAAIAQESTLPQAPQ